MIVIGAKKGKANGGGIVYFIDPKDLSDPRKPHERPMFAMSYSRVIKDIVSFTGTWKGRKPQSQGIFIRNEAYAVINPNFQKEIGVTVPNPPAR